MPREGLGRPDGAGRRAATAPGIRVAVLGQVYIDCFGAQELSLRGRASGVRRSWSCCGRLAKIAVGLFTVQTEIKQLL